MLKTKFELAKEVVDQYNHAFLQGDTFLHIQEWIDEQIKMATKNPPVTINDDWEVTDIEKAEAPICDCCWSRIQYQKVWFTKQFVITLQKILDYVVDWQKNTWQHKNIIHIKDLNLSHTEYTHMNKIANFGLLYRETTPDGKKIKNGTYWVPQKRIFDFLNGDWAVAKFYVVKSTTHAKYMSKERVTVDHINQDTWFADYKTKQLPKYVEYLSFNQIDNG